MVMMLTRARVLASGLVSLCVCLSQVGQKIKMAGGIEPVFGMEASFDHRV